MGIKGAHNILGPAGQVESWTELTVVKGLLYPDGFLVGIDASPLMESAQRSPHQRHQQSGTNGPLKDLFRFLAKLSQYAVTAIFVFDGPERPKVKRDKKVALAPHALTEPFQEFITAFGFYHHQAPGEADAELAMMSRLHAIDMVLSTDSDLVVFGALAVGRNLELQLPNPSILIYSQDRIQENLGMTWGGLILFALAAGGDYDKGLLNCGPRIAAALARTPYGDELVVAFKTLSKDKFLSFRTEWQHRLKKELSSNSSHLLPYRCNTLAKNFPDTFPDYQIMSLYLAPPASTSVDRSVWTFPQAVPTQALVDLYKKRFWPARDLTAVFQKHVIPGLIIRKLIHMKNNPTTAHALDDLILKVTRRLPKDLHASDTFLSYSVKVDLSSLIASTKGLESLTTNMSIKIPAVLLALTIPALLPAPFSLPKLLDSFQSILPMSRFVNDSVEPTEGKGKDRESSFISLSDSHSDVEDIDEGTSIIDISDSESGDSEKDADEGFSQVISDGEGASASHVLYIYVE